MPILTLERDALVDFSQGQSLKERIIIILSCATEGAWFLPLTRRRNSNPASSNQQTTAGNTQDAKYQFQQSPAKREHVANNQNHTGQNGSRSCRCCCRLPNLLARMPLQCTRDSGTYQPSFAAAVDAAACLIYFACMPKCANAADAPRNSDTCKPSFAAAHAAAALLSHHLEEVR